MTQKRISAEKLAELVNGEVIGDEKVEVHTLESIESAAEGHVTFLVKASESSKIAATGASVVVVPNEIDQSDKTIIRVKNPYLASAIIHNYLLEEPFKAKGIHPTVIYGEGCDIAEEVTIEPNVVLGRNVKIGERVLIRPGVYVGDNVVLGNDCVIHANVTIENGTLIDSRVTVHAGTVLGSDGYGYAPDERGCHIKRPQVGIVQIDSDVEIGANCCIDRATFGVTHIKSGTKIDNLVQIGHNVIVGENCLFVSQTGISGSTIFGRNVVMGGQSGTKGHITLGDGVMVAARGGVTRNIEAGQIVGGYPTIPIKRWTKASSTFAKVPEMRDEIRRLRKEIEILQKQILEKE